MARTTRIVGCLSLTIGVHLFASTPADACSPLACEQAHLLPRAGQSIPRSTPGFPFTPASNVFRDAAAFESVQLLDESGAVVATHSVGPAQGTPAASVLVPDKPLSPGNYTFRYEADGCAEDGGATDQHFVVTGATPLPKAAGTLAVAATSTAELGSRGCNDPLGESAVADVRWTLDPELVPYGPMVEPVIFVDGQPWEQPYEGPSEAPTPTTRVYRVAAPCGDAGPHNLSLGIHNVTLRVMLPGADNELTPAETQVTLQCPGAVYGDPPPLDNRDDTGNSTASSDQGCALASSTNNASFAGAALMGVVLTLGAMRSARSRARGTGRRAD